MSREDDNRLVNLIANLINHGWSNLEIVANLPNTTIVDLVGVIRLLLEEGPE